MERAVGLIGYRDVNLLVQTCVISPQAGAFLQLSRLGPKCRASAGDGDAQVTPGPSSGAGRLQSRTVPTSCAGLGVPSSGDAWQVSAFRRCHGCPAEAKLTEPCVTQLCHPLLHRMNSPVLDGGA